MSSAFASAGLVGALGFVVVFILDGATRPGYSARRHPVSALALGKRGWLQTTNFVVAGVLVIVGSVGLLLAAPGLGTRVGAVAVAVVGIGLVGSGLFRMDAMRARHEGR